MADLAGQVALVTGASRGLGRAIAVDLAGRGARIGALARDAAGLDATVAAIRGVGGEAVALVADVAAAEEIATAVARLTGAFGRLDILVNNAGAIAPIGRLADTDPALWATNVTVNLVGAYHALRAALPHLVRLGGVVVDISSGAAHRPLEGWSAYCSAKAGLVMLTRAVDHEYRDQGVLAYGLSPGVVDTGMQGLIRESGINPVSRLARESLAPPEAPARVVGWLCAARPADLAGQDLDVRDPALQARLPA